MNIFYIIIFCFITLIFSQALLSENVFDSSFIDVNIKTFDANETKINSINNIKIVGLHSHRGSDINNISNWENAIKLLKNISLSFNDIKSDLSIPYDSVISFADPYANFGLKLNSLEKSKKEKIKKKTTILKTKNNIVDLNKFRKKLN